MLKLKSKISSEENLKDRRDEIQKSTDSRTVDLLIIIF